MYAAIPIILFIGIMFYAAYSDITRYILSNKLCLITLALYFVFLLACYVQGTPLNISYILYSLAISLVIFLFLLILFALNAMGGGDVKLIPIVALWAGPHLLTGYLLITIFTGALWAIGILVKKQLITSNTTQSLENINFPMAESGNTTNEKITTGITQEKIPYGVGIAIGGLYIAWNLRGLTGLEI